MLNHHENASEIARQELRDEAKLAALRAAIDAGDASGIAEDGVFERVRKTLDLEPKNL